MMNIKRSSTFGQMGKMAAVLITLLAASALPTALAAANQATLTAPHSEITDEIRAFCTNIADSARDQRYLLQKQELEKLQADIEERIITLKERRDDYENWLQLRNEFLLKAEGGLVNIYKNMRADSAAEKLELVNINVAAAIVMKLSPRLASQILNEMDAKTAANLTGIIASAATSGLQKDPT